MNAKETFCPECDYRLNLGSSPRKGQYITCPECETGLFIVNVNPLELEAKSEMGRLTAPRKKSHLTQTSCPECNYLIKFNAHIHEGQRITCRQCDTPLVVVNLNPLKLDVAALAKEKYPGRHEFEEREYFSRKLSKVRRVK